MLNHAYADAVKYPFRGDDRSIRGFLKRLERLTDGLRRTLLIPTFFREFSHGRDLDCAGGGGRSAAGPLDHGKAAADVTYRLVSGRAQPAAPTPLSDGCRYPGTSSDRIGGDNTAESIFRYKAKTKLRPCRGAAARRLKKLAPCVQRLRSGDAKPAVLFRLCRASNSTVRSMRPVLPCTIVGVKIEPFNLLRTYRVPTTE
ncbi:hypothetical protein EVAR_76340_1 [Eumeta japonica]|uniref:Uncharacterized protein n=1 Tax=Eumeta variegata TaxID=151549 RepID=A0A4C1TAH5_EUMVA|nr:hypothetical protein EVAR_76340_1 [Eumeta japonica]